jgi:hypothetical protein
MPPVTIQRCLMRVVRHGGWSWGARPRLLVDDALRALPALLAAELARILPPDAEGEVSAPLRVSVRVGLPELRAWLAQAARAVEAAGDPGAAKADGTGPSGAHEGVADKLRRALEAERIAERIAAAAPAPVVASSVPEAASDPRARAAAVLDLLRAWNTAGLLDEMLRALPEAVVAAWHRVLLEPWTEPPRPQPAGDVSAAGRPGAGPSPAERPRLARLASTEEPIAPAPLHARLQERIRAAVHLAVSEGLSPADPAARAAIDAGFTLPPGARDAAASAERPRPAPSRTRRAASGSEVRVASTLPFLLLGPLHRVGWLDLLEATFGGAGLESALPAAAVALATKVLPEPERGWRRTPPAAAAASAFAGDAEPRPDSEVAELARMAAPLAPALDAAVQRSLLDGRRSADPLVLCSAGPVCLLVDPAGSFLLAHAGDPESAAARASESRGPVFVPAEDADARLLAALDAAGATFVTPAPPVRGERWRPVPRTHAPRLFTNGNVVASRPPADDVMLRARGSWRELERRPLPGRPQNPALDRALALAAALSLATIAWELWRQAEPTDAALALARFGDLEGTVHFDGDRVRVRLPLGKRFHDLRSAGFLDDVPRVPWLGFRPVVFAGG